MVAGFAISYTRLLCTELFFFPLFPSCLFFLNLYIGYSFAAILSPTSWETSTPQRIRENSTIMLTQLLPDKPDHNTLALATLAMDDAIGEDILGRRGKNSTVPMIGLQERYEILLLVDFLIHVSGETGLGAADVFLELFPIRPAPGLFCILPGFSSPATV